jgi:hypothetical protein
VKQIELTLNRHNIGYKSANRVAMLNCKNTSSRGDISLEIRLRNSDRAMGSTMRQTYLVCSIPKVGVEVDAWVCCAIRSWERNSRRERLRAGASHRKLDADRVKLRSADVLAAVQRENLMAEDLRRSRTEILLLDMFRKKAHIFSSSQVRRDVNRV